MWATATRARMTSGPKILKIWASGYADPDALVIVRVLVLCIAVQRVAERRVVARYSHRSCAPACPSLPRASSDLVADTTPLRRRPNLLAVSPPSRPHPCPTTPPEDPPSTTLSGNGAHHAAAEGDHSSKHASVRPVLKTGIYVVGVGLALTVLVLTLSAVARSAGMRLTEAADGFSSNKEGMVRGSITVHDLAPAAWSPVELDSTSHPDGSMFTFTEKEGAAYNYKRSTAENYKTDVPIFVGPYAEIRAGLDYSFHPHYLPERQAIQDRIVDFFLERRSSHDDDAHLESITPLETLGDCSSRGQGGSQWVVFTAGPMGSGKSHTMKWLAKRGYFPLDRFVHADPDLVRNQLPEIQGYIHATPETAGVLTHKEAGFIVEILINISLKRGYDVLVQGSLRDATWHADYFNRLRSSYPGIKIAIVHITAEKETVLERARRRGETTKRVIPPDVLLASLEQTPKAVSELCPVVDYCVTVCNEGPAPRMVTPGQSLEGFSEVWKPNCADVQRGASAKRPVVR